MTLPQGRTTIQDTQHWSLYARPVAAIMRGLYSRAEAAATIGLCNFLLLEGWLDFTEPDFAGGPR